MSLRLRLLVGLGVVALVIVAVGAYVVTSTRDDLIDRVDAQLAVVLRPGPDDGPGGPAGWTDGTRPPVVQGGRATVETGPFTLWVGSYDDGEVETRLAPRNADGDPMRPVLSADDTAWLVEHPGEARTVGGQGADRFRVVAQEGSGGAITLVGASLDDVDASVSRLVTVEIIGLVVALTALGLVAFWVLRLGVRPLKQMTATASEIAAGDLSQRVPTAEPGTEAGELADALNAMLGRLEGSFAEQAATEARLRRFVADASHELRTPITTIRGYAELHRQGALEDAEARRMAMARTEQEAIRMGSLVEDLLLLARLDQGRPLAREPVDLAVLAEDARADAAAAHPDHPVTVEVVGDGLVTGDEDRLRQVVGNLVANVTAHTPPGTDVHVSVQGPAGDDDVRLVVADDGPGMAPEVAARAFERFSRGDVVRSRAAGSTGLGLSIVEAIVAAHGGRVDLRSGPGEGTEVTVTLPRSGPGSEPTTGQEPDPSPSGVV